MPRYSVVIPTVNEEGSIRKCIAGVRAANRTAEIIVIDGGSQDRTINLAEEEGVIVGCSKRGRGLQCNVGASLACGDILLFLHADTRLPEDAFEKLDQFFRNDGVEIGTFRLKFDEENWILAFYALFSRFDSVFTRFGDQGIVIRKSFFTTIGGFPDWPLFEDVGILQTARNKKRIYSFPTAVTTSARRYVQNGVIRQQLQNLWYMLQYLLGRSPFELAAEYERRKRKAVPILGELTKKPPYCTGNSGTLTSKKR